MRTWKITYRVKLKTWEERYLVVNAYTSEEAKKKFDMWEGLIIKISEV